MGVGGPVGVEGPCAGTGIMGGAGGRGLGEDAMETGEEGLVRSMVGVAIACA